MGQYRDLRSCIRYCYGKYVIICCKKWTLKWLIMNEQNVIITWNLLFFFGKLSHLESMITHSSLWSHFIHFLLVVSASIFLQCKKKRLYLNALGRAFFLTLKVYGNEKHQLDEVSCCRYEVYRIWGKYGWPMTTT